jgi:hypothetical protein
VDRGDGRRRRRHHHLHHCRFAATGEELTARAALRFRTATEVDESLRAACFVTEHRCGGWDRRPFVGQEDEIVVVARRGG